MGRASQKEKGIKLWEKSGLFSGRKIFKIFKARIQYTFIFNDFGLFG